MDSFLFTSESVTEGHPDKIADQISDGVLDAIMADDPYGRVACEVAVNTGMVVVFGEITTKCYVEIPKIARETIKEIGYDDATYGFDYKACAVLTSIDEQSPDIALGVDEMKDKGKEIGAGDQGMMVGYACNETKEFMPMPIQFAHKLTKKLSDVRRDKILEFLRPDGKSQVTIEYKDGKPARVHTVVVSCQHDPDVSQKTIKDAVLETVIKPVCGHMIDTDTIFHINPTGKFIIGGPPGDSGLTGRKIIVDTYGGINKHGGGAFSGKDCTKVDRTGAYMGRYVCKNIVAAGIADKIELQVAYAIGVSDPVSVWIDCYGTNKIPEDKILELIKKHFDFRVGAMIEYLNLRRPIYKDTAAFGHFGREEENFTWEKTDKAEALKSDAF